MQLIIVNVINPHDRERSRWGYAIEKYLTWISNPGGVDRGLPSREERGQPPQADWTEASKKAVEGTNMERLRNEFSATGGEEEEGE